jgi:hypothetical protein
MGVVAIADGRTDTALQLYGNNAPPYQFAG